MLMLLVRWICRCALLLMTGMVVAAPEDGFVLQPTHRFFLDVDDSLSPADAFAQSGDWQSGDLQSVNQGYVAHPVWLRFDVDVQDAGLDAFLTLGSAFLDRADLYLIERQDAASRILAYRQAGDHADYSPRHLPARYPLFALSFPRAGPYTLLVRIKSGSQILFDVKLQRTSDYYRAEIRSQVYYGLYFGMMIVLAYFNLMLLIYVRERAFLYNIVFIVSLTLYEAGVSGFGDHYLWLGNNLVNDHILVVSAICCFFFGGRFALEFLELKLRAPLAWRIGNICISSYPLLLPLAFILSEKVMVALLQGVGVLTAIYALAVMIQQSLRGNDWARYLLFGWSTTITGYCMFILAMLGWIEFSETILYLQAAGLGLGNVMVTTAIAARVRRERREKAAAMGKALKLSREVSQLTQEKEQLQNATSAQLQKQVDEKTQELNDMLEYLQHSNRRLERDSLSDPLTSLGNRRYLDSVFRETIYQCAQHRSSLGVLVIDADHFKQINDNHGHLAGDECLRRIASILNKFCRRNLDILVRFGGEEFVMLLPATDVEGVLKVAESMRRTVQQTPVRFGDKRIAVTVSVGVNVTVPSLDSTPEALMEAADSALYLAKRNGRNRIEVCPSCLDAAKA